MDAHHERKMATDLEANPEEKDSLAVYLEVTKEHAAVETGRAQNKRYRSRNLATERRRKPKEWSRRKLAATHRGRTYRAKMARRKGNVGKNQMRDKAGRGTSKRRAFGRRHQRKPKRINGDKNRGLRQQLLSKKEFTKTLRKTLGLQFRTRTARSTVGFRKIKNWTL
jgi:hypothetical protein